jgi:hypothetical protein
MVTEWTGVGIDAQEALAWTELGFDVSVAGELKRAGHSPVQAYGRAVAGAASMSSTGDRKSEHPPSFTESLRQAIGHHDAQIARSYIRRQWLDAEAIAWASQGIEASEALAWKELGLSPTEARRQEACGMSAIRAAKAWWQAGIPFAEVAGWIRSGLTPDEAAARRATGRQPRDP